SLPESHTVSPLFSFTANATPSISTLSLHDALPISGFDAYDERHGDVAQRGGGRDIGRQLGGARQRLECRRAGREVHVRDDRVHRDRKSTRLNSSHDQISYAVFCLKKKTTHAIRREV